MEPGFRAVYEHLCWSRLRIAVLGFRQRMEPVDNPGMADWFCVVFHEPTSVLLDDGWRRCSAEDLVVLPPGRRIAHGPAPARSWLRCNGPAIEALIRESRLPVCRALPVRDRTLHEHWLLALQRECQHPRAERPTLEALLGCWWRAVRRERSEPAVALPPAALAGKRLIEQHYREALSLDGLAAAVGISRTQLCRSFRAGFGVSPMAYAQRLRMAHAQDLLRGSSLAIGTVAERSGFSDVYYFSRAFRRVHGCTPSAFRRGG